jgi:CRISPR-associated protein Csx14
MGEASMPVDLLNPGQVFACLGSLEAADILLGNVDGVFDWSDLANVRFRLRTPGNESPLLHVLQFIDQAKAIATAPPHSKTLDKWIKSWGPEPEQADDNRYPFPDPSSPATLACVLTDGSRRIAIDYWGDETNRDNVKFWAGARGYPGAALARDALVSIGGRAAGAVADPFGLQALQSSSFRLDWRRDYIPLDAGFSLNAHDDKIVTIGYPLVELLGAIGLTHARPRRPKRSDKLQYMYGVVGRARPEDSLWLPPSILRAGLGATEIAFPSRRFRMLLGWPGKENQARSITTVTEETMS